MAKINIEFDGKIYTVDENTLAPLASPLERALIQQLAGTGAVIRLGGTNYNVDANKLASARNVLTNHLSSVAGTDSKATVNGTEYGLSKTKLQGATDKMHETLAGFKNYSKGLDYYLIHDDNNEPSYYLVEGIGTCTDTDIIIPDVYEGLPVTGIDTYAFESCNEITSVYIPDGVTTVGEYAFSYCEQLSEVSLPDSLVRIDEEAFSNCPNLQYTSYNNARFLGNKDNPLLAQMEIIDKTVDSFIIPETTKVLIVEIFANCTNLKNITIPSEVKMIPKLAFRNCSALQDITFGANLQGIGSVAFYKCPNLTNVYYDGNMATWCAMHFYEGQGMDYELEPPSTPMTYAENFYIKTATGDYELLTDVVIPEGVETINSDVFYGWKQLKSITLPSSLKNISDKFGSDYNTFGKCENLTVYYNGDIGSWCNINLTRYHESLLQYTESFYLKNLNGDYELLTNAVIPEGVTEIKTGAFYGYARLTDVVVPDSVVSIGENAFTNTGYFYNESNWENGGFYVGNHLISGITGDEPTTITIKPGTKTISAGAFENCYNLEGIIIPDSIVSIGEGAFDNCDLTSVILPDSVVSIGERAFYNCTSLMSVTIGRGIENLPMSLFGYCSSLERVTIPGTVKSIGQSAFNDCQSLTDVIISDGVESIESYAFSDCRNLVNLNIPNSVTSIGDYAFNSCASLENITIPNSVTSMGYCVFNSCESLTNVIIGEGITSITEYTFSYCTNLTSVTIPDSVTSIGACVFEECSNLTSITIPNSVVSVDDTAFYYCNSLTDIYIDQYEDESSLKPLEWILVHEWDYDWETGEETEIFRYLHEQVTFHWKERT